jgi:hypothetical protein
LKLKDVGSTKPKEFERVANRQIGSNARWKDRIGEGQRRSRKMMNGGLRRIEESGEERKTAGVWVRKERRRRSG